MTIGESPSEVLENSNSQPVNLTKIEVIGGEPFTDNFFNKLLSPLLSTSDLTISQLINRTNSTLSNLDHSDVFDDVEVTVGQDSQSKQVRTVLDAKALNLYTRFQLTPKRLNNFSIGSTTKEYGNFLHLDYSNLNTFGNSEFFRLYAVLNPITDHQKRLMGLDFRAPCADPTLKLTANVLASRSSITKFQSKEQDEIHGKFGVQKEHVFAKCGSKSTLTAAISLTNRSTLQVADSAHDEIKTYSGNHFKEALHLDWNLTNLQYLPSSKRAFPLNGFNINVKNEYSGLTNSNPKTNDNYYKFEGAASIAKSFLNNNFTITSTLKAGQLLNLSNKSNTIHFQDKFYLPLSGFHTLGLNSNLCNVGGLSYLSYDEVCIPVSSS
ncbi:unnamed protein product [Ambrosiozyma monospora]|uniref:Unnamed protein product n=1 Tax=Ambrosiozyma monospora TaxID=43982 RepID=A0A9W6YM88_AMBMO|nr:unnamed protein product [Ambrosiozyma monospora]